MKLNISFKHMDKSDHLKTFIKEKCEPLSKFFDGRFSATWTLSIEKQSRVAHCHVVGNGIDYFGEGSTEDFKASIDLAIDKVSKQLRKHKEIVKNHKSTVSKSTINT